MQSRMLLSLVFVDSIALSFFRFQKVSFNPPLYSSFITVEKKRTFEEYEGGFLEIFSDEVEG